MNLQKKRRLDLTSVWSTLSLSIFCIHFHFESWSLLPTFTRIVVRSTCIGFFYKITKTWLKWAKLLWRDRDIPKSSIPEYINAMLYSKASHFFISYFQVRARHQLSASSSGNGVTTTHSSLNGISNNGNHEVVLRMEPAVGFNLSSRSPKGNNAAMNLVWQLKTQIYTCIIYNYYICCSH